MIILLVAAILMIWGVFDSFKEALENLLIFGFNVGSHRITIGLLITLTAVLYGSYLVSSIVQKLFMDEAVFKGPVEKGVRHSLGRLFHYILMFVAFLVILGMLGVELTQITVVLGALGVGIGFG
jgi:small-conductance mechanosensitive channel